MATGRPRSPWRWVSETIRQIAAQPALPLARNVTRGRPPAVGRQVTVRAPAHRGAPCTGRAAGAWRAGAARGPTGATARSTPSIGRMPACWQAWANFTAP